MEWLRDVVIVWDWSCLPLAYGKKVVIDADIPIDNFVDTDIPIDNFVDADILFQNSGHAVRLVPSGQVYKQIFDAEVQLVKSLHKCEDARLERESTKIRNEANVNKNSGNRIIRYKSFEKYFPSLHAVLESWW